MLNLAEQNATISSVNVRAEKHGEDPVPACDVGITFESGGQILDSLGNGLREALFENADSKQTRVPGTGQSEDGPRRKWPLMRPLGFDFEWPGYKAVIVWGDLAGSINLAIQAVTVKKIKVRPIDGGSCEVSLQMQCHPSKEAYGDLAQLNQREITLELAPPTAAELKQIQADAEAKAKAEARKKAGEDEDPED